MWRRVGLAGMVTLALLWWLWPRPAPPEGPADVVAVRLRRGQAPERVVLPPAGRAPQPSPPAAREVAEGRDRDAQAADEEPTRIRLEDLDADARAALGEAAMERLAALAERCEAQVEAPQSVAALISLDARGVLELEIRPIDPDAATVALVEAELPDALVDCLDGALWDQDWSAAAAAVPEGSELPLALTMHLGEAP